jgi:hypothetical protein
MILLRKGGIGHNSWAEALFYAPKGLENSAQGFNPGEPQNKRFALKGREMRVPDKSSHLLPRKIQITIGTVLQLGPSDPASALLERSIWRSFQGASLLVDDSQG